MKGQRAGNVSPGSTNSSKKNRGNGWSAKNRDIHSLGYSRNRSGARFLLGREEGTTYAMSISRPVQSSRPKEPWLTK